MSTTPHQPEPSAHSPLPWAIQRYSTHRGYSIYASGGDGCVAERWEDAPTAKRLSTLEANAELIVRAVNSYAALQAELASTRTANAELLKFITRIAAQRPSKPDYWSSCSQCEHNKEDAEDLLAALTAPLPAPAGEKREAV